MSRAPIYYLPARETLKRFLSRFTETTDVLGSFDLDPLEAQDRQLKFQGVRFEVTNVPHVYLEVHSLGHRTFTYGIRRLTLG